MKKMHTVPRKFLYVWKFTRIRMEINLHTYAISRENVNHPVAGRFRPVFAKGKQPSGCEIH